MTHFWILSDSGVKLLAVMYLLLLCLAIYASSIWEDFANVGETSEGQMIKKFKLLHRGGVSGKEVCDITNG